jgi:hypothetical protein
VYSDLAEELNELIIMMMAKDPEKRPSEKILRETVAQYLCEN